MSDSFANLMTTEEDLEHAVRLASDLVDLLPFSGQKLHPLQKRAWPRTGVFGAEGDEIVGIPLEVELLCEAIVTCLVADICFDMQSLATAVAPLLETDSPGVFAERTPFAVVVSPLAIGLLPALPLWPSNG